MIIPGGRWRGASASQVWKLPAGARGPPWLMPTMNFSISVQSQRMGRASPSGDRGCPQGNEERGHVGFGCRSQFAEQERPQHGGW